MRFRNITFATTLLIGLALIALFMHRSVQVTPQVRLLRLTPEKEPKKVEPPAWLGDLSSAWIGDALDSPRESWSAEFEIRNPEGSGILLSDGPIDVQFLTASGDWTSPVTRDNHLFFQYQSLLGAQNRSVRIQISVPSGTRLCRFAIRFRPLTLQEQCSQVLPKSGFWPLSPSLSAWASDRTPRSRRWSEYRTEVALPSDIVEAEPGHHPLPPPVD